MYAAKTKWIDSLPLGPAYGESRVALGHRYRISASAVIAIDLGDIGLVNINAPVDPLGRKHFFTDLHEVTRIEQPTNLAGDFNSAQSSTRNRLSDERQGRPISKALQT
uniref:Uncharacterized protein n=1 Tax=Peronospora matthiolae TaxID=2874970 RepID=A0AAV1TW00_9STRA